MYRNQLKFIENWLAKPNRKPLAIRGARQVGKSTLVRLFAQAQGKHLAEFNLERYPDLATVFASNDPKTILNVLEAAHSPTLTIDKQALLFLDEIQATPEAIPALRYFYEELPELALISAGSLLEFALRDHSFSMPVGRIEYLYMGPMTFTEFLRALGEDKLAYLIDTYSLKDDIELVIHQKLCQLVRLYFYVGGMPEAVAAYADTKQLSRVSDVHTSIIDTYREDYPKYIGSRNLARFHQVFNYAAQTVGQKVKYSQFSNTEQSKTIKADIDLLCMARILSKVTHSHCNGLPLQAELSTKVFKLLFLDIGLMNALCGLNWHQITLQDDLRLINEGKIAEQFIGQHLLDYLSTGPNRELTYWLREGKANNAEVDFVIALNGQIVPIEIKSGSSGTLKSLHQFMG